MYQVVSHFYPHARLFLNSKSERGAFIATMILIFAIWLRFLVQRRRRIRNVTNGPKAGKGKLGWFAEQMIDNIRHRFVCVRVRELKKQAWSLSLRRWWLWSKRSAGIYAIVFWALGWWFVVGGGCDGMVGFEFRVRSGGNRLLERAMPTRDWVPTNMCIICRSLSLLFRDMYICAYVIMCM